MSTPNPRRKPPILPPWLLTRPVAAFARSKDRAGKSISDRVMVSLTVDERAGLDRIIDAAKRAKLPLTEPDVMRTALDRLLADVEAAQVAPAPAPPPEARNPEDQQ